MTGNRVPGTDPASTPIRGSAAALVRHMEASLAVPTATTMRTFAVGSLDRACAASDKGGRRISSSRMMAYAVVRAAATVPAITHRFGAGSAGPSREVDGAIHLGIAVDVGRPDGSRQVVVPVLRDAAALRLLEFVAAYDGVVAAARAGRLEPAQLTGANLILTNTAAFGSTSGIPRLPVGPGAVVALGAIGYPAGFEQVAERLGIERTCTASCTYDHRVIQGADSGAFLRELATLLSTDAALEAVVRDALPEAVQESVGATAIHTHPSHTHPSPAREPSGVHAALRQVDRYRRDGHRWADIDPLRAPDAMPPGPDDNATFGGLTSKDLGLHGADRPAGQALRAMREQYCGTLALDVWHLRSEEQREWWFRRFEDDPRAPLSGDTATRVLEQLVEIESLERFMQRTYPSHKTLSVQGLDSTVLVTQRLVELAAEHDLSYVDIGMAHRGRLNILAHVTGLPYARLFAEFEGSLREDALLPAGITGDVKQHLGWESEIRGRSGAPLRVAVLPNPSHLEFVSPVTLGATRAHRDERTESPDAAMAILLHGDASFTGQGVVAETLNLHRLAGYRVGGTVHILQDNQIGFTTEGPELRSTLWPSDIARGYDVPVLHVNADDPAACLRAARLAMDFRQTFAGDVVIHVLGYRRLGHSETDEPTFTQAELYERIRAHPPVAEILTAQLVSAGSLTEGTLERLRQTLNERLRAAHGEAKLARAEGIVPLARDRSRVPHVFEAEDLRELAEELLRQPGDAVALPKVRRVMDKRRAMLLDEGTVDWAHAEVLALAALASEGVHVRMSGQDVVRGAFTQRHLTITTADGKSSWTPLMSNARTAGRVQVWNSPLSETAVLGFEYGYSVARPAALTIWEAQFGDFANAAQVVIDQFIASGQAKWGSRSNLTVLLPHGYEGSGPEHSSARLERYLQLAAEDRMTVAVPTTPAQYFALLVQQGHDPEPRPLVVLTPKSLLRHKAAVSSLDDLATGSFAELLTWLPGMTADVRRVVACSGKVFYELAEAATAGGGKDVALLRLEQLYPFPSEAVRAALASFPHLATIAWAQEEPENMGAARYVLPLLTEASTLGAPIEYVGRQARAAVAEGYGAMHAREQATIRSAALRVPTLSAHMPEPSPPAHLAALR